jgi:predicted MFS family arabinose efflux permease
MSTGFHYLATMEQSLAMQWTEKKELPVVLGRMAAAGSFASLLTFALVYLALSVFDLEFVWVYLLAGLLVIGVAALCWFGFPHFPTKSYQNMTLFVRRRYWLYYALEFMSGARRQIFMVFAAFMMVEQFHYDAEMITLLFLVNCVISIWISPKIGNLIKRWGERPVLVLEYVGLIGVFSAYAFVETAWIAAGLYIVDHLFFALAFAMTSYFRKIADPADIASTAGVAFTINHIAAVGLPAVLGMVWLYDHSVVFLIGSGMAVVSLGLSLLIPRNPDWGNETVVWQSGTAAPDPAE